MKDLFPWLLTLLVVGVVGILFMIRERLNPAGIDYERIERCVANGVAKGIRDSHNEQQADWRAVKSAWFLSRELKDGTAAEFFKSIYPTNKP